MKQKVKHPAQLERKKREIEIKQQTKKHTFDYFGWNEITPKDFGTSISKRNKK